MTVDIDYYKASYDFELERYSDLYDYFTSRNLANNPFNSDERIRFKEMVEASEKRQQRLLDLIWFIYRANKEGIE